VDDQLSPGSDETSASGAGNAEYQAALEAYRRALRRASERVIAASRQGARAPTNRATTPTVADPNLRTDTPRLGSALFRGRVSAVDLAVAALAAATGMHRDIGAFVQLTPELAIDTALRVDRAPNFAAESPLRGVPVGIKDLIDLACIPTRLGTPGAGHRVPVRSARVVRSLLDAGAVPIGKTQTHELGLGMITPNTRNPFDRERIAGGSSGGSAAAVAAGLVGGALGTDTAGSIRCPAALCGVVGLKPTRGVLPSAGVAALSATQDTVGVLAATVSDCASVFYAAGGPLQRDWGSRRSLRVGLDRALCTTRVASDVRDAVLFACDELGRAGVQLVDVVLPDSALAGASSMIVVLHEAALRWGALSAACPAGFGPQVRAALQGGGEVRRETYATAFQIQVRLREQVDATVAEADVHALVMPTVPITAVRRGVRQVILGDREEAIEAVHARLTVLASVTGLPALSVPCGLGSLGLPVGLQLVGRAGREDELFALGAIVEQGRGAQKAAEARARIAAGTGRA
jgi:Asp-tRNA(Asn)/Glu-tRNA(Gln) amidotransferase A subunit family amidase